MKTLPDAQMNQLLRACLTPDLVYLPGINFNFEICAALAREMMGLTDPLHIVEFVQARFHEVCEKVAALQPGDTLICGQDNEGIVEFTPLKVYEALYCLSSVPSRYYGRCTVMAFNEEQGTQLVRYQVREHFRALDGSYPYDEAHIEVGLKELPSLPGVYDLSEVA